MAINVIDIKYNKAVRNTIHEFICDTDTDFALLPKCDPGSIAVSIATGTVYVVNASGNWVEFGVSDPEPDDGGVGDPEPEPEPDVIALSAGLYQTGAIALYEEQGAEAIEGMMIKSWDDLLAEGIIHVGNGVVYTNYDGDTLENSSSELLSGDLILPSDGSITTIGNGDKDDAFSKCYNLTGVKIPAGTTNIGSGAFSYCTSLTTVKIPDGVTHIEANAFNNCYYLTDIIIPDSVTSIEFYAFYYCTSLASVIIPEGITAIEFDTFACCTSLESITIPSSVIKIKSNALRSCENLLEIKFNGTIEQWNAIEFGNDWRYNTLATHVQCSDGQVSFK